MDDESGRSQPKKQVRTDIVEDEERIRLCLLSSNDTASDDDDTNPSSEEDLIYKGD